MFKKIKKALLSGAGRAFIKIKNLFYKVLNCDYLPVILSLFLWKLVDFFRNFRKEKSVHLFGIYGFFGLYGMGKTMGMTYYLYRLRRKYKDKIYICTNYNCKLQDFPFENWEQLLKSYDKALVVAWDEVQNEFNSRSFNDFPVELLTMLTQNRKGNGIMLLYSAQRFNRVDKVFRELTTYCFECKTRFGRLTSLRKYHWEDYEELVNNKIVSQKIKIKSRWRTIFVQSDYLRNLYDTSQMLQSAKVKAKNKEYLNREERKRLIDI